MLKENSGRAGDGLAWLEVEIEDVKWDARGLVPVVAQDAGTLEVLMLAWANREALEHTLKTRQGTYFSRSRGKLWIKGETSGHLQKVFEVRLDCDGDAVLYRLEQEGAACHTGERTCFHNVLLEGEEDRHQTSDVREQKLQGLGETLERVYDTILERIEHQPENSYVTKMHAAGLDRILKKIPEEAGEVLLAAKNGDRAELALEVADLFFHSLFVMAELGVTTADLALELQKREGKSGFRGPKAVG